jgi:hypothetical protein
MVFTTNNGLTNIEIGCSLRTGGSYESVVSYNFSGAIPDNTEPIAFSDNTRLGRRQVPNMLVPPKFLVCEEVGHKGVRYEEQAG